VSGLSDPYSRILHEDKDRNLVKVMFVLPKDLFEKMIDAADLLGVSVEEIIKRAFNEFYKELFGRRVAREKKIAKKKTKKGENEKTLKELKEMISVLNSLIGTLNENIIQVQRISNIISQPSIAVSAQESIAMKRKATGTSQELVLPELKVAEGIEVKEEKKPKKSLEETLDDILVVAVAEDLLKS